MDHVVSVRAGAPFVGRIAELRRLQELNDTAADGNSAAVLLSGDAGVGKTSLIAEAARLAAESGMLVLLGRCVDLGTGALPYQPFVEALSQLVRAGKSAGDGDESGRRRSPSRRRRNARVWHRCWDAQGRRPLPVRPGTPASTGWPCSRRSPTCSPGSVTTSPRCCW
jgi:hypothetical protein